MIAAKIAGYSRRFVNLVIFLLSFLLCCSHETFRSIKPDEREDRILQALAGMLAKRSGISVSTIYRCFSNKSKMFEALIAFIEKTLFVLINKILQ